MPHIRSGDLHRSWGFSAAEVGGSDGATAGVLAHHPEHPPQTFEARAQTLAGVPRGLPGGIPPGRPRGPPARAWSEIRRSSGIRVAGKLCSGRCARTACSRPIAAADFSGGESGTVQNHPGRTDLMWARTAFGWVDDGWGWIMPPRAPLAETSPWHVKRAPFRLPWSTDPRSALRWRYPVPPSPVEPNRSRRLPVLSRPLLEPENLHTKFWGINSYLKSRRTTSRLRRREFNRTLKDPSGSAGETWHLSQHRGEPCSTSFATGPSNSTTASQWIVGHGPVLLGHFD